MARRQINDEVLGVWEAAGCDGIDAHWIVVAVVISLVATNQLDQTPAKSRRLQIRGMRLVFTTHAP